MHVAQNVLVAYFNQLMRTFSFVMCLTHLLLFVVFQRRSSLASESLFQEELRKVRSKAVEDMLRTPPAKYDSSFSIAATKESMGAGFVGEEIFKPHSFWKTKPIGAFMDVGVNADPALVGWILILCNVS